MSRLILVPQYPAKLRYQEWWWDEFPKQLNTYFNEIIVLGKSAVEDWEKPDPSQFSPVDVAINFELFQISEYIELALKEDDVLLLNDLSFPGLFAHVLFHKRPKKCWAICHATSKNNFDYFEDDRNIKFPIETSISELFNGIIVGSKYHRNKLLWGNVHTRYLPDNIFEFTLNPKEFSLVSVARDCIQKRNQEVERFIMDHSGESIYSIKADSWSQYYSELSKARIMVITSQEETFGYQVLDAIKAGVIPLAPNKFSYPELLPEWCLYNDKFELQDIIYNVLDGKFKPLQQSLVKEQSDTFFEQLGELLTR